jgi:hypothetical protein
MSFLFFTVSGDHEYLFDFLFPKMSWFPCDTLVWPKPKAYYRFWQLHCGKDMAIQIRGFAEKDLPALVDMSNEFCEHSYKFHPYDEEKLRSRIQEDRLRILMAEVRAMNFLLQKGMTSVALFTVEQNISSMTLLKKLDFQIGQGWKFLRRHLPAQDQLECS